MAAKPIPIIRPGVKTRLVTVTPEIAAQWLSLLFAGQRPVNRQHVQYLAREMKAGLFQLNGEAIVFSATGSLIDGQHRLHACIAAGVSFDSLVVEGVAESAFASMGGGRKRTLADVFAICGEKNATHLAAGIVLLFRHVTGKFLDRSVRPSSQQGIALLEEHPDIRQSVLVGMRFGGLASTAMMTFFHYVFSRQDSARADAFFRDVQTGTYLAPDSPAYHLRARLLADHTDRKRKMTERERYALVIKAWHADRDGRSIRILRWTDPEPFPPIDRSPAKRVRPTR